MHINKYLNKILKTNNDYIVAMDTDSCMVVLNELVKPVFKTEDTFALPHSKVADFLDIVGQQIEKDVLEPAFEKLAQNVNAYKPRIKIKREVIASRGIFVAKKRYIMSMLDKEGVRYKEPKLKIMGIEAVKSSTPGPCRDAFKDLFKILISGTEQETQEFIQAFRERFKQLPVEDKAFPRGVSSVTEYKDSKTIYRKGTPINSRAAILYNHLLDQHNLADKYEVINDNEKIKYIMLKIPNPLRENVIGFMTVLPPEFGLHRFVDDDLQFEKAFVEPTKLILDAIGWHVEPTSSLEDFFG